jgi:hypothetical protein
MTDEQLAALAKVRAAVTEALSSEATLHGLVRIDAALARLERLARQDGLGERGA